MRLNIISALTDINRIFSQIAIARRVNNNYTASNYRFVSVVNKLFVLLYYTVFGCLGNIKLRQREFDVDKLFFMTNLSICDGESNYSSWTGMFIGFNAYPVVCENRIFIHPPRKAAPSVQG